MKNYVIGAAVATAVLAASAASANTLKFMIDEAVSLGAGVEYAGEDSSEASGRGRGAAAKFAGHPVFGGETPVLSDFAPRGQGHGRGLMERFAGELPVIPVKEQFHDAAQPTFLTEEKAEDTGYAAADLIAAPVPASLPLLGAGLLGLMGLRRRSKKKA